MCEYSTSEANLNVEHSQEREVDLKIHNKNIIKRETKQQHPLCQ